MRFGPKLTNRAAGTPSVPFELLTAPAGVEWLLERLEPPESIAGTPEKRRAAVRSTA